ncbi:MAG: glycosyltransferase family 39 protein [Flavobacteriaceae bacterium]|nr:glycosyltransferase family 39 protein [Flavobacteriaceae bacterium]
MISVRTYLLLYLLLAIALGFGLFLPLMENDSAQHATMAMRMAKSGDYLSILKGGNPYLDKPHMHFWLSALSFEIFGFEEWAYRLPALILTILGGFATFKLANLLYDNVEISRLSAFMFLTSQAIVLGMHDVRTDAVLTAFTVLAVWQWVRFLKLNSWSGAVLGGIFTAFAFSTKGLIAIAVIGIFLFFMVLYHHYWKRLLQPKFVLGLIAFALACVPVFYAYYHQFGMEGIEFISMGQVTGRYSGEDFGGASQNDYFFYFHTILWTFLPWSIWFYSSLFLRIKSITRQVKLVEISTILTVLIFLIVMNFSSFKLPHYLNIIFPFVAIFTAGTIVLYFQQYRSKLPKVFQITQYILASLGFVLLGFLGIVAFAVHEIPVLAVLLASILLIIWLFLKSESRLERTVVVSAGFILFTNIYLNSTFYPQLLKYQSGYSLGVVAQQHNIKPGNLYMVDGQYSWPMDWMIGGTSQKIERKDLNRLNKPFWVMMRNINPNELKGNKFNINKSYRADHFRVTRLSWDFINPLSRSESLEEAWLVEYVPK